MLLLLPLGLYLPEGVKLQFGKNPVKAVGIQTCDPSGCLAESPIADAEIAAMAEGQAVTVSVQDANKKLLSQQVPSTGFAAAYSKVK
jgi:invasion protein IalB